MEVGRACRIRNIGICAKVDSGPDDGCATYEQGEIPVKNTMAFVRDGAGSYEPTYPSVR